MLRLIIIFVLAIAVGLFISRLFSRKRDDSVIDGEVIDADGKPNKPSLLPIFSWIASGWGCRLCSTKIWYQRDGIAPKSDHFSAIDQRFSPLLTIR